MPAPQQQVEFFVTADQGCGLRAQRLETADDIAFAKDAPGALRFGKTGERLQPEILEFEQGADLASRVLGNDECAGCSQRLQPRGEVGRLADDAALLCGTRADQ